MGYFGIMMGFICYNINYYIITGTYQVGTIKVYFTNPTIPITKL